MVLASISIISSSSSFPSISNSTTDYSPPSTSTPFRTRTTKTLFTFPTRTTKPPFSFSSTHTTLSPKNAIFRASYSENVSPEQFLNNNSIADFMRFKRGGDGGSGELQTAVVSYKKKLPWSLFNPFLQVDLVSTIHIADEEYFLALQKELESYDCVLYEMVASRESLENRRNPIATKRFKGSRSSRGFNILGFIQRQMASILRLDFQLDCVDYQGANWYHADLDFETFKLLQQEKGESFFSFARDMTLRSTKAILQPSIPEDLDPFRSKLLWASRVLPMPLVGLFIIACVCADMGSEASEYPEIKALSRLDFGAAMKVFLAKRLTSEFTLVTAEVEEKSVIIGERNRVATEALQKAMDEGNKKIAIFYGGGHMPDLGRRLREEFDLVPSSVQWITAWSIRKKNLNTSSFPFLKKMARVSGWPLNRYETLALLIFSSVLAVDLCLWEVFFGTTVNWASELGSQLLQYFHIDY
ncbi:PREDICTED: uncharacterized protein LOC109342994 [Lupinus angustifolius]|uniref:uncharacterized protein LOC109342994 n=1 Tax=Lupinus angustifolius TaxID=3871 RepID=UPI00092EE25A|nr:PREDICTED: uncharacterized protein LOC109342994 [Lupinus angustifolius]